MQNSQPWLSLLFGLVMAEELVTSESLLMNRPLGADQALFHVMLFLCDGGSVAIRDDISVGLYTIWIA
jgi:hypothetical protein